MLNKSTVPCDAIFWWGTLAPLYPVGREGKSSFGHGLWSEKWYLRFDKFLSDMCGLRQLPPLAPGFLKQMDSFMSPKVRNLFDP